MQEAPKCTHCGSALRGLEDPHETIRRAERGELQGWCHQHDWQDISHQEQQILADIARNSIPPV